MGGNPKTSKWRSCPEAERHTQKVTLHLSPESAELLNDLAQKLGTTKSAVVEEALEGMDKNMSYVIVIGKSTGPTFEEKASSFEEAKEIADGAVENERGLKAEVFAVGGEKPAYVVGGYTYTPGRYRLAKLIRWVENEAASRGSTKSAVVEAGLEVFRETKPEELPNNPPLVG